jgi:hypothetical protein
VRLHHIGWFVKREHYGFRTEHHGLCFDLWFVLARIGMISRLHATTYLGHEYFHGFLVRKLERAVSEMFFVQSRIAENFHVDERPGGICGFGKGIGGEFVHGVAEDTFRDIQWKTMKV